MRNGFNRLTNYKRPSVPVLSKTWRYQIIYGLIVLQIAIALINQRPSVFINKSAFQTASYINIDTSIAAAPLNDTLIKFESEWKYLDNGTDPGIYWTSANFTDSNWKKGIGKFGYGINGINTIVGFGDSVHNKYITTYFRKAFQVTDSSFKLLNHFSGKVNRDDGVIIYINGKEVLRSNMPLDSITPYTFAPGSATGDNGTVEIVFTIPDSVITPGENIIAAEIHQYSNTSPDMAFDLELIGKTDRDRLEPPAILYYEGFEDNQSFARIKKQVATNYGFTIDSIIAFKDAKAGRWELHATDTLTAKGKRAETLFSAKFAQEETWYSFAAYFPSDSYQKDRHSDIINQWHQGIKGLPMLTLRTANDHFLLKKRGFDTLPSTKYNLGPIAKDRWISFVIHLKQHPTNGVVQIWIDDELKLDIQGGATMFEGPYGRWKMGLYKSLWENKDTLTAAKRVWFVDEVKIGNASSNYSFMKPEGNHIAAIQQQTKSNIFYPQKTDDLIENALVIYPTLIKKGALLTIQNNSEKATKALITDLSGRIHSNFIINGSTFFETSHLQPGTYILMIEDQKKRRQQKFVIMQ